MIVLLLVRLKFIAFLGCSPRNAIHMLGTHKIEHLTCIRLKMLAEANFLSGHMCMGHKVKSIVGLAMQ